MRAASCSVRTSRGRISRSWWSNDDGGSIFATLEQGADAYAASFERVFGTPHGVDIRALCAATATPHELVTDAADLASALAEQTEGIRVIEVRVPRSGRRLLSEQIRQLGRSAG